MKKELKDVIGTDPEDLFNAITVDFMELAKYEVLFLSKDCRKFYLEDVNRLYSSLIRNCRFSLAYYYKKEIENIFPEEVETLPKTNEKTVNTIKTVKFEKTWSPVGPETEES